MREQDRDLDAIRMTPPLRGACPVCAYKHNPSDPHFPKSAYYMLKFSQKYGRLPTWQDAMKHCAPEKKAVWIAELKRLGVNIEEDTMTDG